MKQTDYYALLNLIWEVFYDTRDEITQSRTSRKSSVFKDRHIKAFEKILNLCLEEEIDPVDYVERSFDILLKQHKFILPCDIARRGLVKRYRELYDDPAQVIQPEGRFNNQVKLLNKLCVRLIPKYALCEDEILINPATPFEPWFRVVYANNMQDIVVKRWGEYALKELFKDKNLMRFCVKNFPAIVTKLEKEN